MKSRLFLLLLSVTCSQAQASTSFPQPPELNTAVNFWVRIFTEVSQHQVVLHDRKHLEVVYNTLDFSVAAKNLDRREYFQHVRKVEQAEKDELGRILRRLAEDPNAADLPPVANSIKKKFERISEPDKFARAAERIRGQRGLYERFREAIAVSGAYLPYMEEIFAAQGLPVELTRLPLVESSFNVKAYSKSGAAGIWQFIPSSARRYMRMDEVGDDRRDPWFSTEAAARHLADDYAALNDWPMAVTAYNYGRYGIARALEEIGASSLVELIERYDGPRWGFASKNFYAEFLAALHVEQNAMRYFGPIKRDEPLRFEEVTIDHYVPFETLGRLIDLDLESFQRLNPTFSTAVIDGHLFVPPGQRIRVPRGTASTFSNAYASLDSSQRYERQRDYFVRHKVRSGETLSGIAYRYRSSVKQISRANNLSRRGFIRAGQVLKIPTGSGGKADAPRKHRVRSGETLVAIARRYHVSARDLQRLNGIAKPELLQVGAVLLLPADAGAGYVKHTVRAGQTVGSIARKYGVSVREIAALNGLTDVHAIRVGQTLKVPARAS